MVFSCAMLEFPKLLSISSPLEGTSLSEEATETYRTKQQWQPSGNMCHLEWHSFKGNATIPHPVVGNWRCGGTVAIDGVKQRFSWTVLEVVPVL